MSDTVVITTDDLEPAVRLRGGFEDAGLKVELLTSGEGLEEAAGEPVLLVLTGHIRERRAQQLIQSARREAIPVLGLVEPTERLSRETCRQLGVSECLPKPIDVEEAVLLGRRLVARERLRAVTGIVGQLEESLAQRGGAGERALLVAEQLRLQQSIRQGRHVHRDEAPVPPR